MKQDIILCGVGGQGILPIATIIGWAALDQNLQLKMIVNNNNAHIHQQLHIFGELRHLV